VHHFNISFFYIDDLLDGSTFAELRMKEATMTPTGMKIIALVLLVAQSTSLVLCMRQSRLGPGPHYSPASAVIVAEVVKLLICFGVVGWKSLGTPSPAPMSRFTTWVRVLFNLRDALHLAVVGGLYAIQNNLLYTALTHLHPAIYQVTYQLKVLTTAGFSVVMLKKRLSKVQWTSLLLLAIGVAIVQLTLDSPATATSSTKESTSASLSASTMSGPVLGFVSILIAACTSGFAGVLFEAVLKRSSTTLWERNIQLALFGLIFSVFYSFSDAALLEDFFRGYTPLVWSIIFLQATGGLLIAMVVSYTDNIVKAFATSFSIILSAFLSIFFGDLSLAPLFYLGALVVILATYLYSDNPPPPEPLLPVNQA
jgi:UDP-galactose transporter